jgi:NPCBM/NEW2 domain
VLMLPTGKSVVAYNPLPAPVGTVQGRVRRDGDTMVRLLVFEAVNGAPAARATLGPAAVACGKRALTGPAPAYQQVTILLDCLAETLETQLRKDGFDVATNLWRSGGTSRLPAAVAQTTGVLRWIRGLQAGNFAQLAGEVIAGNDHGVADRFTVLARWAEAPRWVRPAGVTPLFDLVGTASVPGPSGQRTSARLGGRSYPDSAGAWVACADPPATLTYQLAGKFRRLTAVVGLAEFAPPDLAVRFQLTADDRTVADSVVDQRRTATVNVDLSNVDSLVISAVRTAGDCPPSPLPFGVLGEASLFPS